MTDPEPMPMTEDTTRPPPGALLLGAKLLAALLVLSSLAGLYLATLGAPALVLGMFAFELVTLLAAALAVFAAFGAFARGWALALACIAGTVFGATMLGYIDGRPNFLTSPDSARMLQALVIARVLIVAAIGALASVAVFAGSPRAWRSLFTGLALGLPVLVALAVAWKWGRPWLLTPQDGAMEIARLAVLVVGSLVGAVMFSAAVHLVIRAYERGLSDQNPDKDAAKA